MPRINALLVNDMARSSIFFSMDCTAGHSMVRLATDDCPFPTSERMHSRCPTDRGDVPCRCSPWRCHPRCFHSSHRCTGCCTHAQPQATVPTASTTASYTTGPRQNVHPRTSGQTRRPPRRSIHELGRRRGQTRRTQNPRTAEVNRGSRLSRGGPRRLHVQKKDGNGRASQPLHAQRTRKELGTRAGGTRN